MKPKRILFINPSGWEKVGSNLGLAYLSGTLLRAGHSVLTLDLNRSVTSDADVVVRAQEYLPDVIGVSVKSATAREGARVARVLARACPHALVVAGGPHVTVCPERYFMDNPVFTLGIQGDSEESLMRVLGALDEPDLLTAVPGLVYRVNERVVLIPREPIRDLDSLAPPDFDSIEGFDWHGFVYPLLTSRGCPYHCIACSVHVLAGSRNWHPRSPENVVSELERVHREKGIESFEIIDDNFSYNLDRAKEICRLLIARGLKMSWAAHGGLRADKIDRELAILMKQAGCMSVAIGIESGNPQTFRAVRKGETLNSIVEALETIRGAGMKTVGYFLLGIPGDTLERFIDSVRFQRSLKLDDTIFNMLAPYPGTKALELIQDRGRLLRDHTEMMHYSDGLVPVPYEMPEFPYADVVRGFFVTRYFELYDAVDAARRNGSVPYVLYFATSEMVPHIWSMAIACDEGVTHIVVADIEERAVPRPAHEPDLTVSLLVAKVIPADLDPRRPRLVVCQRSGISWRMLFDGSGLVIFDPSTPKALLRFVEPPLSHRGLVPWIRRLRRLAGWGLREVVAKVGIRGVIRYLFSRLRPT